MSSRHRTKNSMERAHQFRKSRSNSRSDINSRTKYEYPKESDKSSNLDQNKYNKLKPERRSRSPNHLRDSKNIRPKTSHTNHKSEPVNQSHQNNTKRFEEKNRTKQADDEYSKHKIKARESLNSDTIKNKEEPNFKSTGLLASEDATQNGILLKHTPPIDSRKPDRMWRLYMFKRTESKHELLNEKNSKIFHIHRNPTYLFGKDGRVADIPLYHASISKQHAVLQFRLRAKIIRPYLMDLESTNGTFLNDEKIDPCRYHELREEDVIRFGNSTREFILLNTDSVETQKKDYKSYLSELENS